MARRFRSISPPILAVTALLAAGSARADCKKASVHLELTLVSGPSCTSPVGLCAASSSVKGLKADWTLTATSLLQSADTPTTSVVLLTADETFHGADGDLVVKSAGAFRTLGGELASVAVIVGGSGAWAGATGTLTETGLLVPGPGTSTLWYSGEICTP